MPRTAKPKPKPRRPSHPPGRISRLQNRNVHIGTRRTSVRLEPELWSTLENIAAVKKISINDIVTDISVTQPSVCLTSAMRVFIVKTLLAEV